MGLVVPERMNKLESKALSVFKALGWKAYREKTSGDAFIFIEGEDRELRGIIKIYQLLYEQKMELFISSGSKEISRIVGRIFGERPSHEILLHTRLEKRASEISSKEIEEIGKEAVAWWKEQDNMAAIKALTAPAPSAGQAQLMHLAALAYLGDFDTLMDYQAIFRRGKRLNFVSMIEPEMIDRAVTIAFERS